jgi:Ca2+-binding RTX toxin-like protein
LNGGAGTNVINDAGLGGGADTILHDSASSTVAIAVTGTGVVTLTASQVGATATSAASVNTTVNASTSMAAVTLLGNSGNDSLTGGSGNDTLTGGSGNDTLKGGAGTNVITDAGSGADTILHNDASSTVAIAVTGGGTVTLTATQAGATATSSNGVNTRVNANATGVVSTAGVNLNGGTGNDTLTGGSGNDTIIGGDGNDNLVANNGLDSIVGGNGADTLEGVNGNDTLTGGAGADIFGFNAAPNSITNNDIITDFSSAESDKIRLAKSQFTAYSVAGPISSSTFLSSNAATITTNGINLLYNPDTGALGYLGACSSGGSTSASSFIILATLQNKPSGFAYTDISII